MPAKKFSTQYPGVRYREHKIRIYNRKLDRYFFIRYRIDGKQKEEAIGWASEGWNATRASGILSELREAHRTGNGPQTLEEKRRLEQEKRDYDEAERKRKAKEEMAFGMYFIENYLPEAKENKTYDSWRRENNLFEYWINPVVGKMPFKNIRPFHIERIKKNMKDAEKAPRSIQYAIAVIRQIFNHAIKNEIYSGGNPATKVGKPKIDNERTRFLTDEEAESLLNNLITKSKQTHDIALLSLECGLRASEIFKLKWNNIDTASEIITVDGKGGKSRPAFMNDKIKSLFSNLPSGEPSEFIFTDRNGKKIERISNVYYRTVEELGFNDGIEDRRSKVCFHTLRHTFASRHVQNGTDLYKVQKLLGHSTIAMTERYSHLADDNLKAAVKKLEANMKRAEAKNKPETVLFPKEL
jgi:site-specific recombinase XerD